MRPSALLLTIFLLTFSVVLAGAAGQAPAAAQAPPEKKQITDTAEYNAYVGAINESDPARKVQLLDEFLAKYPNTVVKEDALELKLVAQQQAGQPYEQTARQVLQINSNNFRALLVLSFLFVQTPLSEQDPQYQQKLSDAENLARRGMGQIPSLPRPENVSEADFQKSKDLSAATFHQALGLVARHRKDFPAAQAEFKKGGELAPDDASIFYRLGDSYIAEKPPKYAEAFWAFARAAVLEGPRALPPAGKTQVNDYLTKAYTRYHGSEEGLDKLKESAKAAPFPPEGFRVVPESELKPATPPARPTPTSPESVSFDQIKEVLAGGGEAAKALWAKLKGQTLSLEGKVVSATPAARPRTVRLAVLPATAEAGGYDVLLTLAAASARPLPAGRMVQFEGVASNYTPSPFSLRLAGGKVVSSKATPGAPRSSPRTRRRG